MCRRSQQRRCWKWLPLLALLSLVMTRAALCPKALVQQLSGA